MKLLTALLIFTTFLSLGFASSNKPALLSSEQNTIQTFHKMSPLVVNVHNLKTVMSRNLNVQDVQNGVASGFLWDNKGYVVTNYHVIRGATKIAVTLKKGKTIGAKVVGVDPAVDIAVLKLKALKPLKSYKHFKSFPLANSADLLVGQKTIAIGNPFGLDHTLTTGIISALGRSIPGVNGNVMLNLIQTDASINPGNSGGPLLDSNGRLIGMNTMIVSKTGTYSGIGFAVPSDTIKRVVDQIIRYGRVEQPGIGIEVFSDSIAKQLGVSGVVISKVLPGTPAARIGLQGTWRDQMGRIHLGNVIVGINGRTVKTYEQLVKTLSKVRIGQRIKLKYLSNGRIMIAQIRTIDVSK